MANKDFPTSVAQDKVLKALGLTASGFSEADAIFEKLGLSVSSKRVGRSSEPVVLIRPDSGGVTLYGEGEDGPVARVVDLTPILPWIIEAHQAEAQRLIAYAQTKAQAQQAPVLAADALSNEVKTERAAEAREWQETAARQRAERQARAVRNTRLYAAGYRWHKEVGDDESIERFLAAPDGHVVSVAEALAEIDQAVR